MRADGFCVSFTDVRNTRLILDITKHVIIIMLLNRFCNVNIRASSIIKSIKYLNYQNFRVLGLLKCHQFTQEICRNYYVSEVINKNLKTDTVNFAKAVKRKVDKENPDLDAVEVVKEEKKGKPKPVKRGKAAKEEEIQSAKEEEIPEKKKRTARAGTSKKKTEEVDDSPDENENAPKKVTKPKKTKDGNKETNAKVAAANKEKKITTRANRGKKADTDDEAPQSEEESSEVKPGRKRRAAPKAAKNESAKDEPESKTSKVVNATVTNWEAIDFKCPSKNSEGKTSNFHITSWNVDGLRAWLKKGGLDILKHDQPDIFCVQETKCSLEKLPEEVTEIEGYETFWCSSDKEGYAGVGIITKVKPLEVRYGINSEEHDSEGRCITAEYKDFFLVNVYVPNAGRKLVTLPKRLEWNELFKTYIKELDDRKPVIVCGDMNVAHTEIDLANPKTNTKNAGFTVEEREGMTDFLQDGYIDSFRKLYPDKEKAYTFWTYMAGARAKNVGWRLDYFLVSERFMKNVCDNIIHNDVLGSDHCPLALHINV